MVAQPKPARMNMAFIAITGQPFLAKEAKKNAEPSIIMPAIMVFFLPNLEASKPAGI